MRTKFSDKYSVDELGDRCFPIACLVCAIVAVIYVAMCIANPWNIVLVPLVICGLLLVGCLFLMCACSLSVGLAKLIYLLEGADE